MAEPQLRRHFQLPEADEAALNRFGLRWETVEENQPQNKLQWLIIYDRPVYPGYNVKIATTAFLIPSTYPDVQIDMVYFFPSLARADGKAVGALTTRSIEGKNFQQWSRHRTGENPWRPGEDDLESHLLLVDYWLKREFGVRP